LNLAPEALQIKADLFVEFELDSDDLDDESLAHIHAELTPTRRERHRDQRMPLLVGLLESSDSRRSLDGSLPLHDANGLSIDELEEIAGKRVAGGGILDSTANMANSILGAGNIHVIEFIVSLDLLCSSFPLQV
jgi:solute carrier family 38 (sodium-coupled neutral amino acid transporter), member 11